MEDERYPGESTGLRLFLEELSPVVASELGPDSLLHHAVRRALASHRLAHLRHARRLFNHLPRPVKQRLSMALLARAEDRRTAPLAPASGLPGTGRRFDGVS